MLERVYFARDSPGRTEKSVAPALGDTGSALPRPEPDRRKKALGSAAGAEELLRRSAADADASGRGILGIRESAAPATAAAGTPATIATPVGAPRSRALARSVRSVRSRGAGASASAAPGPRQRRLRTASAHVGRAIPTRLTLAPAARLDSIRARDDSRFTVRGRSPPRLFRKVRDVQERVALQAQVDEGRLHARQNARYASF